MPWIRSFRHLGIWVAFTENDWHEMSCVSFGLTQGHAERRAARKFVDSLLENAEEPT